MLNRTNSPKIFFFLIQLFITTALSAQLRVLPFKTGSAIRSDIEKVVADYYVRFDNLKGEIVDETPGTIEYKSKLLPQGAVSSTITQLRSVRNVYTWQSTMLITEDFETAAAKYKELYKQLAGSVINCAGKPCKFIGDYDVPEEERSFAASILQPDVKNKGVQKLKIEIGLNYLNQNWNVKILVYEKQSDEDIRPSEKKDEQELGMLILQFSKTNPL